VKSFRCRVGCSPRRFGENWNHTAGAAWSALAVVHPQASRLRALARSAEHPDRRVVGVDLVCCAHIAADGLGHCCEKARGLADPVRQRRARQVHALAREDLACLYRGG
jgi:hypothetical protein